ncbi:porin family protein [Marinobacter sp. ELB17]|uniref:porin family protein n=1 Tax=Marinobacter sp. ELB17 TaxID=270374 RepID=UPI0000F381D6|nr:porin family protein [Marinobacter sp. ELB17]EAZ98162.1 hypothetical protein MELB17_09768 [Marinobacter sp. ELB17]
MNYTKSKLIGAIAALIICAPMASAAPTVTATGFYLGAQTGWNDTTLEGSSSNSLVEGNSASGVSGAAFAGYQAKIPNGILAIEVNAGASSAEFEKTETAARQLITSDMSYGISARLGTDIARSTQFYGLVGYQSTDFELTLEDSTPGSVANFKDSKSSAGASIGFGIQAQITDALAMRVQWTRTLHDEKTFGDLKLDPSTSQVSIGVMGFF